MLIVLYATFCALLKSTTTTRIYQPPYLTLPPTPLLPRARESGYLNLSHGVDIWYEQFGPPLSLSKSRNIAPILFLHGALANANYFGYQISALLARENNDNTIIAIYSRMQGRSTGANNSISYILMREDVISVLDHFDVPSAIVVGWSDGAIIGLNMAMNTPARLERLFAFGTSYLVSSANSTVWNNSISLAYEARITQEYSELSPTPNAWPEALHKVTHMLNNLPNYTQKDFSKIPTLFQNCEKAPLIWIVDAADEEVIKRDVPTTLHNMIPGSGLVILPSVSHFGFLQDPDTFNTMLERFLDYKVNCR